MSKQLNKMDFVRTVVNEIALEGLDGITLSALWQRLTHCEPPFPLSLDPDSKQFIWSSVITSHSELEFFALQEPRPPLVITKRSFEENFESTSVDPNTDDEIYPYKLVQDGDVVGSCSTYYTRQNITAEIRPTDGCVPSLDDVLKKYGERLVVVASQSCRKKVLLNNDTDQDITLTEKAYCMLEKIGRSRYNGVTTHGKAGLSKWLNEKWSFVFYLKKKLCGHGLITSQGFRMMRVKCQPICGRVFHLKKFFVEVKPRSRLILERLTRLLSEKPNQMEVFSIIRSEMNISEHFFRRIVAWAKNYVKAETVLAKDMFPDAEKSLLYHKTVKKPREVRVVKLLRIYTHSADSKDDLDGDDVDDDFEADDDADEDEVADLDPSGSTQLIYEQPLLTQMYDYLEKQGGLGAGKGDIMQAFKIPQLDARRACVSLNRLQVVRVIMTDVGKQREHRYVARSVVHRSTIHKEIMEERRKILEHHEENKKIKEDMGDASMSEDATGVTDVQTPDTNKPADSNTTTTEPDKLTLTESIIKLEDTSIAENRRAPKNAAVTAKMLKRANLILDAVRQAKVIDNVFTIHKLIIDEEKQENVKGRMDRKSLRRLLGQLEKDGQLKIFKSCRMIEGQEKEVTLLCDVSMTPDNILVKNTIESAFNKKLIFDRNIRKKMDPELDAEMAIDATKPNYALLKSDCKVTDMKVDSDAGHRYGYLPRMKRYQTTHEFLWYLVYGYGKPMYTPGSDSLILDEEVAPFDQTLDSANLPVTVYVNEASFRRFLPPLKQNSDYGPGWFLVGDILLLLPLTIFLQVIKFNFKCEELEEYLSDPILKWLLVCHLPSHLRRMLMFERRYIFQFYEVLQQMNKMGLITVGVRDFKEKEQIFMYLHKNASIVDTVIPKLTSEERPVKKFHFDSANTVREYWFNLQWICTNTPLAHILITRERLNKADTLERFQYVNQGKAPSEVVDDGTIPGNGKGAAGLDSSFFSHKKSNWTTAHTKASGLNSDQASVSSSQTPGNMHYIQQLKSADSTIKKSVKRKIQSSFDPDNADDTSVTSKRRTPRKVVKTSSGETVEVRKKTGVKPNSGGKGVRRRTVSAKIQKASTVIKKTEQSKLSEKERMDDLDLIARNRMTRERSDWSSREDSLLLLWRVCLVFLCGWRRDSVLPYRIIRDYLHKELPESLNKTTVACKRRLSNMLKIKETIDNVNLYVGEAYQDKELVNEFKKDQCYKKIKSQLEHRCDMITKCYEKLREKFMSRKRLSTITLPDTREELEERYEFYKPPSQRMSEITEPNTQRDVHFYVLQNIIHCATLLDDKTCRAHELYHLLSQYPEALVNQVFNSMRSDSIITKIKKDTVRRNSKLNSLPAIGMGTYMLSQRYTYFWITKYPRLIFTNSYEAYHPLRELVSDPDRSSQWVFVEPIAGYAAMMMALMPRKELIIEITIPEDIVTLDNEFPKKASSEHDEMKTESDAEEEAMIDEAERLRKEQTAAAPQPDSGQDVGIRASAACDKENESAEVSQTESATHTTKTVTQSVAVTSAVLQDNDGDHDDGKAQPGTSMKTSSVTESSPVDGASSSVTETSQSKIISNKSVELQFHGQLGHKTVNIRHLDPMDHLVVNRCTIRAKLREAKTDEPKLKFDFNFEALEYIKEWNRHHQIIHPKTAFYILKSLRSLQPAHVAVADTLTWLQQRGHCSTSEVLLMAEIHEKIKDKSFSGLTGAEMKAMYGRNSLFQRCLNLLLETRIGAL